MASAQEGCAFPVSCFMTRACTGRDAGEQREGGAAGTRPRQAQGQGEGHLPWAHGQYIDLD
jgi:hypothetical protein